MLILSDGTKVWLNSETEMEYPLCFGLDVREVRLKGEAYFEVKKDVKRKFNVVMDGATLKLLEPRLMHPVIRMSITVAQYLKLDASICWQTIP